MNLMSKDISDDFPNSEKIYLNNASVSLMPSQSIEAMREFLVTNTIQLVQIPMILNHLLLKNYKM